MRSGPSSRSPSKGFGLTKTVQAQAPQWTQPQAGARTTCVTGVCKACRVKYQGNNINRARARATPRRPVYPESARRGLGAPAGWTPVA